MSQEIGSLHYDIDIDDRKLHKGLNDADSKLSKLGHSLAGAGKMLGVGLAAAGAAAIAFGVASVKAFSESEDMIAQTNAVLKSTGGIAGVTADQVTELATALQKTTKFSDEEIRSAENMLLTFTNISKDVFPETTKTVLDMSQALGQDLKSSSIQLGKALNNPIDGITALTRVGVKFTDAQKEQIEALVKSGQVMEAQKVILKELQTEFGGSAEAAGNTFAGKLARLKNSLNDVQETIGKVLVDSLAPFATKLLDIVAKIDWEAVINKTKVALSDFWQNYIVPAANAIQDIAMRVWNYLYPSLNALWDTITNQLIPALTRLWQEVIAPMIPVIGVVMVLAFGAVIDIINALIHVITPLIEWISKNNEIVWAAVAALTAYKVALGITALINAVNAAVVALGSGFAASTISALGFKTVLTEMALPAGALAIFSAAAILAISKVINVINQTTDAVNNLQNAIADTEVSNTLALGRIKRAVDEGKTSAEHYQRVLQSLNQQEEPVPNAGFLGLGGLFRQHGGPVQAGHPYIVGEGGAELFVPNQSGRIVPNGQTGTTINIGTIQDRQDADYLLRELDRKQQIEGLGLATL